MHTEYYKDESGDNEVQVADADDFECECGTIVPQDQMCTCGICGQTACPACVKMNYMVSEIDTCQQCIDDDKFLEHVIQQRDNNYYDKLEYKKTLQKLVQTFEHANILTAEDIGVMQGYVKTISEIVK